MPTQTGEHFWEYTEDELLDEGEEFARNSSLRCGFLEAVVRIKAGEYEGTILASNILQTYFLLGG
jgi:hypothetical protein